MINLQDQLDWYKSRGYSLTSEQIKAIQRRLGVVQDGVIGPVTLGKSDEQIAHDLALFDIRQIELDAGLEPTI